MVAGAGYLAMCFCIGLFAMFAAGLAGVVVLIDKRRRERGEDTGPTYTVRTLEPGKDDTAPAQLPPKTDDENPA